MTERLQAPLALVRPSGHGGPGGGDTGFERRVLLGTESPTQRRRAQVIGQILGLPVLWAVGLIVREGLGPAEEFGLAFTLVGQDGLHGREACGSGGHQVHPAPPLPQDLHELRRSPCRPFRLRRGAPADEERERGTLELGHGGFGQGDDVVESGDVGQILLSPQVGGFGHSLGHGCRSGHGNALFVHRLDGAGLEPPHGRADNVGADVAQHAPSSGEVEGEWIRPAPFGGPSEDVGTEVDRRPDVVDRYRRRFHDGQRAVPLIGAHGPPQTALVRSTRRIPGMVPITASTSLARSVTTLSRWPNRSSSVPTTLASSGEMSCNVAVARGNSVTNSTATALSRSVSMRNDDADWERLGRDPSNMPTARSRPDTACVMPVAARSTPPPARASPVSILSSRIIRSSKRSASVMSALRARSDVLGSRSSVPGNRVIVVISDGDSMA